MPDSSVVASESDSRGTSGAGEHPWPGRPRPSRRQLTLVSVPIIGLIILSNVGDALAPDLVNSHPLRLLAMNARNRNLILVTNNLDAPSYYIVGTLRLLLADPLFFLLGHWYGDTAIHWIERRTRTFGQTLRQMEGWFAKAAYPVVFIAPNQYICLFAGAAGMSVTGFFLANISGTVVRLYLIRRLGETFEAPIDDLLDLIREYRTPLLVISIAIFAVVMVNELRREGAGLEELAEAAEHEGEVAAEREPKEEQP
jgi:membrane protein DedA with SNARE-associated domain